MATSNSGSTALRFNPLDVGLLIVSILMTLVMTELATLSIFAFDFKAAIMEIGVLPTDPSMAWLLAVVALGITIYTNDNTSMAEFRDDVEQLPEYYAGTVLLALALVVGWLVIPGLEGAIIGQDFFGVLYVGVVTTSQLVMGWML